MPDADTVVAIDGYGTVVIVGPRITYERRAYKPRGLCRMADDGYSPLR